MKTQYSNLALDHYQTLVATMQWIVLCLMSGAIGLLVYGAWRHREV